MNDAVITVEGLSKRYRIGTKAHSSDTFGGAAANLLLQPVRNLRRLRSLSHFNENRRHAKNVIWALNDVSFQVKQGEALGIIGRNGSGKSTLLKVLSRITEPTSGRAFVRGRVSSLLEVGTGFHPELTGRDNVYLNGAILGMTRTEIGQKFDQIVDFAGVEQFIDTPVKHYSSGMKVRLAFAVAAHLEPEILLVDEVLAVGDAEFQQKCLGKMTDVAGEGRTVLFVSHDMSAIQRLCPRAILLQSGQISEDNLASKAIAHYLTGATNAAEYGRYKAPAVSPPDGFTCGIIEVQLTSDGRSSAAGYFTGQPLEFTLTCAALEETAVPHLEVGIDTIDGNRLVTLHTDSVSSHLARGNVGPGQFTYVCRVSGLRLMPAEYRVSVLLHPHLGRRQEIVDAFAFTVLEYGYRPRFGKKWSGNILCDQQWSLPHSVEPANLHGMTASAAP